MLPSQDDPFSSFGCHIALTVKSNNIPKSVNNDLDCFYENIKDGKYANDEHAIYSFLLTELTGNEYRQLLRRDSNLLKTLKYEPNYSSLAKSAAINKSKPYIHHLCQRKTVIFKSSKERKSLSIFTSLVKHDKLLFIIKKISSIIRTITSSI